MAWTGTEALFLGGVVGGLCPPTASCVAPEETARDGAAYNPATGTWRPVAPAPVDLPGYIRAPVVGDRAYVLGGGQLVAYDASDDTWLRLAAPPGPRDGRWSLTEAEGRVVALRTQQRPHWYADQLYDPATRTWTPLPRDPLVPSFDREVTETSHGLLLSGQPEVDQPGSELSTSLTRVALLDQPTGSWRRLPVTGQLRPGFTWTGHRLVAPWLGGADGGQANGYGRTVPYGGRLSLPTGSWSPLPNPPAQGTVGWTVHAVDGAHIASEGWLYDDARGTWARLARPTSAPESAGAAVWAGDLLVVFGGYTPDERYSAAGLSRQAFSYEP